MADDDITNLSYERALEELDGLISQLETGRVDLEQSLICYERGTDLARHCQELLDRTEAKVSKVVLAGGGRIEERPYDVGGDDMPVVVSRPAGPLRARSAPVLFPGYEPPDDSTGGEAPPVDPDDIPF